MTISASLVHEAILTLSAEIRELKDRLKRLESKGLGSVESLRQRGIEPCYVPSEPKVTFADMACDCGAAWPEGCMCRLMGKAK